MEIRERAATEAWLYAGLGLMRLTTPDAEALALAATWVLPTLDEVPGLPPAGVVTDVGHLLLGRGRSLVAGGLVAPTPRARAAVRAYEDGWLARLATDPRLDAAMDAVLALAAPQRALGVAVVVAAILARTGFAAGVTVNVAAARRLLLHGAIADLAAVHAALHARGPSLDVLTAGYEGLVRAARTAPRLLDEPDLFTLRNLGALESAAQRLAVGQALEVAAELGRALPLTVVPRRHEGASTPTRVEDESTYPAGGFASIATVGSLENLVTSELVYMEDSLAEVDLFDVRYAEGELLYYTRDEAVHVRPRRAIVLVLHPSLAGLRFKDRELGWQRVVLLLGLVVCVAERLFTWLAAEDLLVDLAFVRDAAGGAPLAPERSLATILLRSWMEHGSARVRDATLDEIAAELALRARRASVQIVHVGPVADAQAFRARVDVGTPIDLDPASLAPAWSAWTDAANALVRALV
jgi:hypothetical protein